MALRKRMTYAIKVEVSLHNLCIILLNLLIVCITTIQTLTILFPIGLPGLKAQVLKCNPNLIVVLSELGKCESKHHDPILLYVYLLISPRSVCLDFLIKNKFFVRRVTKI